MNQNTTALLILSLLVAAGAYWYIFHGGEGQPSGGLTEQTANSAGEQRFQTLVSELTPITFDTSLFGDPRFMSLVDLSTAVAPEASGRLDPFAPIGSGGAI